MWVCLCCFLHIATMPFARHTQQPTTHSYKHNTAIRTRTQAHTRAHARTHTCSGAIIMNMSYIFFEMYLASQSYFVISLHKIIETATDGWQLAFIPYLWKYVSFHRTQHYFLLSYTIQSMLTIFMGNKSSYWWHSRSCCLKKRMIKNTVSYSEMGKLRTFFSPDHHSLHND